MKSISFAVACFCVIIFAASCGRDNGAGYSSAKEGSYTSSTADSSGSMAMPSVSEATPEPSMHGDAILLTAPDRKIIKTADLRCRVSNVFATTTHIERLTNASGGQIADSKPNNITEETHSILYKTDSLLQVASFTTIAHLTLRIPVAALDTVLTDIAAQSDFVNSRSLYLDDVTLRYLSNKLKADAMAANDAAQRARALARRSSDAIYSGNYIDERDVTRIDRRIELMQLSDQVAYTTLSVDLYQPQRITRIVVPNVESLMKPTISQQVTLALNNGWSLLRIMIIVLLEIWPLLLITIAGIVIYRRRRNREWRKASA